MKDAHDILVDYGIKSMGQQIIAFEVEKLLKIAQDEAFNEGIRQYKLSMLPNIQFIKRKL